MKENIVDLVDVSIVGGQIVVTPKDGVYVQLVDKAIDEWVDNWEKLGNIDGFYIRTNSAISSYSGLTSNKQNINTLKTESQAIAAIAIAQLTQLMAQPCVNGDWKPDWNDENHQEKWCIEIFCNRLQVDSYENTAFFLAFKDKPTAEKFLQKYRSYIEQAAPILFGVEL